MRYAGTFLIAATAVISLSSCSRQLDEMHIRITPDQHGTFSATGSASLSEGSAADPENSSEFKAAQGIEGKLRNCGLATKTYARARSVRVDARAAFQTPEELNSFLQCVPTTWKDATVDIARAEGWLGDDFTTTLVFRQNVLNRLTGTPPSFALSNFQDFPTRLSLVVPGKIASIDDQSQILGGKVKVGQPHPDLALIEVRMIASDARSRYQTEQIKALQAGRTDAGSREDVVKIVVRSATSRVTIDTGLGLFTILFGSGLLVGAVRLIFRVRS